jgi:hypothetical protein
MADSAYPVTRQAQQEMGLLPTLDARNPKFVAPYSKPIELPSTTHQQVTLDVTHPATQHVVVSTSAVDRAKGYQLVITPLAIALGVIAVIVSITLENDLFSFASFCFFWITFVLAWLAGWIVTALATPEFVSWYGAKRQWDIIQREQEERWSHYRWLTGRDEQ